MDSHTITPGAESPQARQQLLVLGLLPQQLLCAPVSIPVAFSYCSKSQDHFPVCEHPVQGPCALAAVLSSLSQQQTGQHDPGQREAHGKGCHVQLTDLSVHPGLGCVMAAAICLVGINAVFTGGDCHPAVLQNWSLLVSAKVRWQPVWAGWAPVSPGTTASAWAHGACIILPSPVGRPFQ